MRSLYLISNYFSSYFCWVRFLSNSSSSSTTSLSALKVLKLRWVVCCLIYTWKWNILKRIETLFSKFSLAGKFSGQNSLAGKSEKAVIYYRFFMLKIMTYLNLICNVLVSVDQGSASPCAAWSALLLSIFCKSHTLPSCFFAY